ncbi:MAG: hypothetical protein PUK24_01375 [Elusimicrobia bacterium]|nr:hypothetical protein [Elusimicrobiota bacterium]MDY6039622.1 hypothetical protein [Elusimicrobiaceae bacterium]
MKRFYLFVLLVMVSLPVPAKNKISMVTYFPVPYVAYSQVNTTEQMDIGLTSACDMKLGCSESSAPLNAAQVNLKGGKLNLDGGRGIKGDTLSLGNGSGEGKISFQNVRIHTGTMESMNAGDIKATNLNLFGKTFPSCKSANSESGGQMQWTSLKLKGASSSELYLMCGALKDTPCCSSDELSKGKVCNASTHTCECPEGKTENSSGYCAEACTPSANYTKVFGGDLKNEMAYHTCEVGWEGKTSPYRCRSGENRTCKDAYRTSTRKGVFHKDYYRSPPGSAESAADCGGSNGFFIAAWSSGHPSISITQWVDLKTDPNSSSSITSSDSGARVAQRFCETLLPSYSVYKPGIYGLYYCVPQGASAINGARTHVFGYCELNYEYMFAQVTCCP